VRDELSFTGMSPGLSCVPHGSPTSRCYIGLIVLRDSRGETMKRARWNERRANRMADNRKAKKAKTKRGKPSLKSGPRETWIFFRLQTKYLNGREHTCRQRPLDAQVPFETHSVVESANA